MRRVALIVLITWLAGVAACGSGGGRAGRGPGTRVAAAAGVSAPRARAAAPSPGEAVIGRAEHDPSLPVARARAGVLRACRRTGIACPTVLPISGERGQRVRNLPAAGGTVLLDVSDPDAIQSPAGRPLGAAHLLIGQTAGALGLAAGPGQHWPGAGLSPAAAAMVDALRIPSRTRTVPIVGGGRFVAAVTSRVIGRAVVDGRRALVLEAAPYPQGGIHGGHVIVVWNASGHGHVVSVHYDGAPLADRIQAAVAVADSETPSPGRGRSGIRESSRGVAAAILHGPWSVRATAALCRPATAAERRAAPFGATRRPEFVCRVVLAGRPAGEFVVQILADGCFVGERRPAGQGPYGCGRT